MPKLPFDIHKVMDGVREGVNPYPPAAMFALYEAGHTTAFEQLVACIISIRTLDETMLPAAKALFARAPTPEAMAAMTPQEIDKIIVQSSFHERKAEQILALAQRVAREYGGILPCDAETIMSFKGVGLKCANLVLGIACGQARVGVDVHVHRVTNRWGYVNTTAPERTSEVLEEILPGEYWVEINRLLVPFGKHICTGRLPRCSTCPVLVYCQQIGVEAHR